MQLYQRALFGKKVLVVGLGRSGIAAARLCAARGAQVTVTDTQPAEALTAALAQLPAAAKQEVGGHRAETFLGADIIVLSPGVPRLPEVEAARKRNITVTGELELASWFVDAPIVAITGPMASRPPRPCVVPFSRPTAGPPSWAAIWRAFRRGSGHASSRAGRRLCARGVEFSARNG